ncbi:MAG: hypothetical protein WD069_14815 [Planctomycetales bacterium]
MAFEVTCGNCGGRLLIDTPGVTVACPHCDAHITADDPAATPAAPIENAVFPNLAAMQMSAQSPAAGGSSFRAASAPPVAGSSPSSEARANDEPHAGPPPADATTAVEFPDFSSLHAHDDPPAAGFPSFGDAEADFPPRQAAPQAAPSTAAACASTVKPPAANGQDHARGARRAAPTVPLGWFIIVAGLASALLLACIALYFQLATARPHHLESLPDVAPKMTPNGQVMRELYDHMPELPRGHTLSLTEQQSARFGNLRIQPLRVTREPLEFVHYHGDATEFTPQPVLKLWLRLENVSDDQAFVPLDADLLWGPSQIVEGQRRGNTFVSRVSEKSKPGRHVLAYHHSPTMDFQPKDLPLGRKLGPGQEMEIYVPSEEGIDKLSGPLVWRLHLRKGHGPNGRGVTTLVEIAFDSSEIR